MTYVIAPYFASKKKTRKSPLRFIGRRKLKPLTLTRLALKETFEFFQNSSVVFFLSEKLIGAANVHKLREWNNFLPRCHYCVFHIK